MAAIPKATSTRRGIRLIVPVVDTIWELEPHTKAKHVILRKYLDAWIPKQTKWNDRVIICDGFAGPGVYKHGEDGSPIIALKAFLEHTHQESISSEIVYLFIEKDKRRFSCLEQVLADFEPQLPDNVTVRKYNEDYDVALNDILDLMDEGEQTIAPTFAFIDPFGIKSVSLNTMTRLMEHRGCEIFVNFMMTSMQRFLDTKEFESHCDAFFESEEWRTAIPLSGQEREEALRVLYQRRLQDEDGVAAKYVRFFTMKNEANVTIYDLFFATNHEKGIDSMKDAMWNIDPSGEYSFSDATNPNQEVLFEAQPNWDQLIDILVKRFGGLTVPWIEVAEEIRRSPFRVLKNPIKDAAGRKDASVEIINPAGIRRNTINNEATMIRFSKHAQ